MNHLSPSHQSSSPTSQAPLAVVALGSNLAPREQWLQIAISSLRACLKQPSSLRCASIWETEPMNCPSGSADFFNTVVSFPWHWNASSLLTLTQAIEQSLGRQRLQANAPRRIDLDILFLGQEEHSTKELTLPHPRIQQRLFVLEPLNELVPNWLLANGMQVNQALTQLRKTQTERCQLVQPKPSIDPKPKT